MSFHAQGEMKARARVALVAMAVLGSFARETRASPTEPGVVREGTVRLDFELGTFLGLMNPSNSHNLRADTLSHAPYDVAPEVGFRAGFLPVVHAGVELETAWLWSGTERDAGANLFAGRAHVLGRLPLGKATPFVLVGAGVLGAGSSTMGTDTDPAVHFGWGVTYALAGPVALRLDVRDTVTQRFGAEQGSVAHHPELLLGVTLALEPRAPHPGQPGYASLR